jgi:tetraacyldisaccharide 4'-kinase
MKAVKRYLYAVVTDQATGSLAGLLRAILMFFSFVFFGLVVLIKQLYRWGILRSQKLPCPVISVGNITWGGVGKTPLVLMIAKQLFQQGFRPVILTRGYGAKGALSDEALMMRQELPEVQVLVGKDRIALAREYLKTLKADVFLLDDGFQQWRVKRDLEIVTLDAVNPFGNGFLIPRGILREPLSALRRADLFFLTKANFAKDTIGTLKNRLSKVRQVPIIESHHQPKCLYKLPEKTIKEFSFLKGKRIAVLCGIGDPVSFVKTLEKLGAQVIKTFAFLDHHWYSAQEITDVINKVKAQGLSCLVTTAKDAVRLGEQSKLLQGVECMVLTIEMEIDSGKNILFDRIHSVLCR